MGCQRGEAGEDGEGVGRTMWRRAGCGCGSRRGDAVGTSSRPRAATRAISATAYRGVSEQKSEAPLLSVGAPPQTSVFVARMGTASLGTFATAVEAAHAYARALARQGHRLSAADDPCAPPPEEKLREPGKAPEAARRHRRRRPARRRRRRAAADVAAAAMFESAEDMADLLGRRRRRHRPRGLRRRRRRPTRRRGGARCGGDGFGARVGRRVSPRFKHFK